MTKDEAYDVVIRTAADKIDELKEIIKEKYIIIEELMICRKFIDVLGDSLNKLYEDNKK